LTLTRFSALQRAEIAEIASSKRPLPRPPRRFSALQRAEIAEIRSTTPATRRGLFVSVLFNEPKLLKYIEVAPFTPSSEVSVLFNEPKLLKLQFVEDEADQSLLVSVLFNEPKLLKFSNASSSQQKRISFQCSSTSRNC